MLTSSVLVALLSAPAIVDAQVGWFVGSVRPGDEAALGGGSSATQDVLRESRALPPMLSVLLPGTGQLAQEQRRGWAYLALEAVGWVVYADRRNSASAYRSQYRDLAWETARANGTERIDGDFTYYERLIQWERSGRYDRDPGSPGVQPETDPSTFNGSIWDRARRIYGVGSEDPDSPGYRAALDYYRDLAYGESFLWDWSRHPDARERYASLIRTSDTRFQHATIALGFVIANHLISAADAFVSVRGLSLELAPVAVGTEIRMRWEWAP